MFDIIEDSRNEFKEKINDKIEKEIIAFLTSNGGNLYIGIKNNGTIIGIDEDIDKTQLEQKDRIKNNIQLTPLGLIDMDIENYDDKKIIHITSHQEMKSPII